MIVRILSPNPQKCILIGHSIRINKLKIDWVKGIIDAEVKEAKVTESVKVSVDSSLERML